MALRSRQRLDIDRREHDKLKLERSKFALEKLKLRLECDKFEFEREKIASTNLLEDFKARWQELLNFENENNRWSTLYVTALLLVISWILNNAGRYNGLAGLIHEGDNAYFILSLAWINAIFTLSMAIKGYQIQQIALYQFEIIYPEIFRITKRPFKSWERYRREKFHDSKNKRKPERIRSIYYVLIAMLPAVVSGTILALYFGLEWKLQWGYKGLWAWRNWYSLVVAAFVLCSAFAAISTASLNKKWGAVLEREDLSPPSAS